MRQEPFERWKGLDKLADIPIRPLKSIPEDEFLLANGFEKRDLEELLEKFYQFMELRSEFPLPEEDKECLFNPFICVLLQNNKTGDRHWDIMYLNEMPNSTKYEVIFNYGLFVGEYEKSTDCTAVRFVLISDAFVALPDKKEVEKGELKPASEYPDRVSVLMLSFSDLEGNIFEVLLVPYKIIQQGDNTDMIICSDAKVLENKLETGRLESAIVDVFVYGYCMNKSLGRKSIYKVISQK
jgi:hypothetical protein